MNVHRTGGPGRRFGRFGAAAGMLVSLVACGPQSNPQTFLDAMGPDANGSADLAMAALARGDYAGAERNVDTAIKRDPHNPYALLAGGMLYQSTNRPLRARQMYEDLLSLRPNQAATVIGWDPSRVVPLADIAAANMNKVDADLRRAGVMPAVASIATPGLTSPAVAPVDAAPIQALDPRTRAIADRFKTLQKLRDEQLITPEEHAARRNANLGALLPLTKTPPAAGLDRPVPAIDQVVERLKALQRGLQGRAITPREYDMERETILDALLPTRPTALAAPEPAPHDLLASAERMRQLERLRTQGLITDPEMKAEQSALEAALRGASAGAGAGAGAAASATGPRMLIPGGSASAIAASPLAPPLPGQTSVHLASYRSEAQAQAGWDDLVKRFPRQLTTLAPDVRNTPVAGKPDNYRLYAGPFASRTEAASVCKALAAKRQFCNVTND